MVGLGKQFKIADDDNSNDLNFDEFKKALRDFRISTEVKDAEILTGRLNQLQLVEAYVSKYYSESWIRKNVLRQTDDEIEEIDKEIEEEKEKIAERQADQQERNAAQGSMNMQPDEQPEQGAPQ
jgi:hypothetical protein